MRLAYLRKESLFEGMTWLNADITHLFVPSNLICCKVMGTDEADHDNIVIKQNWQWKYCDRITMAMTILW